MTATACNSCVQASEQELGPRRARGSKSNLLHGVARQSSAVNLTTLSRDSDLKRLIEEVGLPCTHISSAIEGSASVFLASFRLLAGLGFDRNKTLRIVV